MNEFDARVVQLKRSFQSRCNVVLPLGVVLWFKRVNLWQCVSLSTGVSAKTYGTVLNWSSCCMVVSQPLAALLSTVNLLIYLTVRYATLSIIVFFVVSPYFATPLLYCVNWKQKKNKNKHILLTVVSLYVVLSYSTYYCTVLCFILIHSCCCAIAT